MCTGLYTQSLLGAAPVLNQAGMNFSYCAMFNESLIQRGRNALVHQFLRRFECTHLMFIDADIRFDARDIVSMVQQNKDIICGIYPKKEINWNTVHSFAQQGVPADKLKNYTGSFVINILGGGHSVTIPINQPFEIENGGTGFMLIKREVFEDLATKVNTYTNDVWDLSGSMSAADQIHEFFPVFIDPASRRLLSEDYAFCQIARKNGYKIWAAPWVNLGHIGTYLFEGNPIPTP
jgi:hypothetical protein